MAPMTDFRRRSPTDATLRYIENVRTRPSTIEAENFFANWVVNVDSDDDTSHQDDEEWRSLPERLGRLRDYLKNDDKEMPMMESDDKPSLSQCYGFSSDPFESQRIALTAAIFARSSPTFLSSFRKLFSSTLASRQSRWEKEQNEYNSDEEPMEEDEEEMDYTLGFDELDLYDSLRTLGWIQTKLSRPLGEAIHDTIFTVVKEKIEGDYEDSTLFESVMAWKDDVVTPWVRDVVGDESYESNDWHRKLDYAASECFCDVRIKEIFDIVADFPDSLAAVQELSNALDRTRMHGKLASELRASLSRRLIHPGANTSQIIDVYINTIKVFREIDPSDELLEAAVAEPGVRSYLRGRSDTVRCIITSLTDEEAGDLYDELRKHDARLLEEAQVDSDDEEDAPDFDWNPAPSIHKQHGALGGHVTPNRKSGAGDILAMLVGIYGSKELFVNEYRVMLADKLLANLDYDTDKEVHNLELLKLRFGEISMRQCEIMIKDLDDSKRIISNIHSTIRNKASSAKSKPKTVEASEVEDPVVDAAIVSHIFWPALQKAQLKNHPRVQSKIDQFNLEYAKLKNPRRLAWFGQLGTVELELEVMEEDGHTHMKEFSCSPLHATLIMHFEDKESWTASELSEETGVPEEDVRRRMGYWLNNRVVRIASGTSSGSITGSGSDITYELSSSDDLADTSEHLHHTDEDEAGHAVSVGAQEAEAMEIYESYVMGMLTNLGRDGQLPLDRIHNYLKTFVAGSDQQYDKSPQQLRAFLQKLCREEKLECGADGMYKLVKK